MNIFNRITTASLLMLLTFSPVRAFAHGDITATTPIKDAKILALPAAISIEFDSKLQRLGTSNINSITATDSMGRVISDSISLVEGSKISAKIIEPDATGLIKVHYRIVSEDGHPVEGDYSFTVGQNPTLTSATNEESAEAATGTEEESGTLSFVGIIVVPLLAFFVFIIFKRIRKR